jgi:hypothetical protein
VQVTLSYPRNLQINKARFMDLIYAKEAYFSFVQFPVVLHFVKFYTQKSLFLPVVNEEEYFFCRAGNF